jgi:predicted DNA-binding transcriptional regulator YafY
MVATVQSTPVSTASVPLGGIVPAIVTADYLNAAEGNISAVRVAFDTANEFRVAYDTFRAVLEATQDGGAVVVLYADAKAELVARVLWPDAVALTKEKHICCKAFCTHRREWRTFRLDRFVTCHALITPDEVAAA